MIDKKWIGHILPVSEMALDRSRLRFFAKAIGETAPEYTDVQAAQSAGYADLPAPPTFLFGAELDSGVTDALLMCPSPNCCTVNRASLTTAAPARATPSRCAPKSAISMTRKMARWNSS